MSYEVANDKDELLGQFATGKGLADLRELVFKFPAILPALNDFIQTGVTSNVSTVCKELRLVQAKPDVTSDIASTADALYDLIKDQTGAVITSGSV